MTWRNALSLSAEIVIVIALVLGVVVFSASMITLAMRAWRRRQVREELSTLDRISLEATARLGRDDQ